MSDTARTVEGLLAEAGLLPDSLPEDTGPVLAVDWPTNLFPSLIRAWDGVRGSGHRTRASRWLDWLNSQVDRGACLTWGVRAANDEACAQWLGPRLGWWPRGIPHGRRVVLVSSRLGRKVEARQSWFTVLRAACAKLHSRDEILVSASSTATGRYVERCATLFGLRHLRVVAADRPHASCHRWLRQIRRLSSQAADDTSAAQLYLSPVLTAKRPYGTAGSPAQPFHRTPLPDRVLVAMSDRLVVLHLRRDGNIHRLIRARLFDDRWPVASVQVALGQGLTDKRLADGLLAKGAVGWMVLNTLAADQSTAVERTTRPVVGNRSWRPEASPGVVDSLPGAGAWDYLTHCTRRPAGAWPDQNEDEFLDSLILDREGNDRSPLVAIQRIIAQRRLIASGRAIRGGTRVVSFTSIPLGELHRLRVFRSHRVRWDFLPYGICIKRGWLEQCGTRPVRYATDRQWSRLAVRERPFFQLDHTQARRGRVSIDWTVEQEWRHLGDLSLHELPADAGLVFAPTVVEAQQLAQISPWPVVVVPEEEKREK